MADNRIAYGLCKELDIDTTGMEPYECWKALKDLCPHCEQRKRDEVREIKKEKAERIYGTSNEDKQPELPKEVYKFNRIDTKHHKKHIKETEARDKTEYEENARNYWLEKVGTISHEPRRNRFYKYDAATKRLLIIGADGTIHTFMKITKKQFDEYIKGERLNEILRYS